MVLGCSACWVCCRRKLCKKRNISWQFVVKRRRTECSFWLFTRQHRWFENSSWDIIENNQRPQMRQALRRAPLQSLKPSPSLCFKGTFGDISNVRIDRKNRQTEEHVGFYPYISRFRDQLEKARQLGNTKRRFSSRAVSKRQISAEGTDIYKRRRKTGELFPSASFIHSPIRFYPAIYSPFSFYFYSF